MTNKKKVFIFVLLIALVAGGAWLYTFYRQNLQGVGPAVLPPSQDITKLINTTGMPLKLPEGFSISIFAKELGNPRVMTYDPYGNLLVSTPSQGKVLALGFKEDGTAKEPVVVAENLNYPHGLAFRCTETCKLYIAESNQVSTYDYSTELKATNKQKIIDLPGGGNHKSRTIMFMPYPDEDKLLISVGSSCNVCNESSDKRAKILVSNYDGTGLRTFAKGLRNSVFMAIHPVNGKIWATEMGRDLLGDNTPPDEINIIEENNSSTGSEPRDYGWPICYGKNNHDTEFDKNTYIRNPCMEPLETPSYIDIPAHSAPLGLAFVPEEGWPQDYWYNAFVSYHGSWDRSAPTGYKIVRYKLDAQGKYLGEEDFITGWLQNNSALGRPVDILVQPGGTMFISDDKAGVIYKVTKN